MSDAFGRQGFKEVKSGLGGLFSAGGGDEEENLVYQRVPQGGKAAAAKPVRPLCGGATQLRRVTGTFGCGAPPPWITALLNAVWRCSPRLQNPSLAALLSFSEIGAGRRGRRGHARQGRVHLRDGGAGPVLPEPRHAQLRGQGRGRHRLRHRRRGQRLQPHVLRRRQGHAARRTHHRAGAPRRCCRLRAPDAARSLSHPASVSAPPSLSLSLSHSRASRSSSAS